MLTQLASVLPLGIVLPVGALRTELFAVLAAFVAINTLMYLALALAKTMPKVYFGDWIGRSNRRAQTRSIHPELLEITE